MVQHILFVYGTLKRNQPAHSMLEDSKYLGRATTAPQYALYDCGHFPAMVESKEGCFIDGELYAISDKIRKKLDDYEGVKFGHYKLEMIKLHKIVLESAESFPPFSIKSYLYCYDVKNLKKISSWC